MRQNVIIMGAAGRDFHNYLTFFKGNPKYNVVCFTAEQIPGIDSRYFPKKIGGKKIPIFPESQLAKLVKKYNVDIINLAYSDLSHEQVMHKASIVNSLGCDFILLGPKHTMLKSKKKIIAVNAVRTGCGKSQTTRYVVNVLRKKGKVVVVRHPMPYGSLDEQICQRFATHKDLDHYKTTIEEREEYEPIIDMGVVVYAGVDYRKILRQAEKEADYIVFDGGNNDTPFYKPDLHIVLTDPHRPGHEVKYYPGETNLMMADVVIINKTKTAKQKDIKTVYDNIKKLNPNAVVIKADSPITLDSSVKGKVLVIEDGPTLTHGGMPYGAGTIAAKGMKIVDPRPYLSGSIKKVFENYPHLGKLLPAMGYGKKQTKELEDVINRIPCDYILSGTPIDLNSVINVNKPIVRARYELKEPGTLKKILTRPKL